MSSMLKSNGTTQDTDINFICSIYEHDKLETHICEDLHERMHLDVNNDGQMDFSSLVSKNQNDHDRLQKQMHYIRSQIEDEKLHIEKLQNITTYRQYAKRERHKSRLHELNSELDCLAKEISHTPICLNSAESSHCEADFCHLTDTTEDSCGVTSTNESHSKQSVSPAHSADGVLSNCDTSPSDISDVEWTPSNSADSDISHKVTERKRIKCDSSVSVAHYSLSCSSSSAHTRKCHRSRHGCQATNQSSLSVSDDSSTAAFRRRLERWHNTHPSSHQSGTEQHTHQVCDTFHVPRGIWHALYPHQRDALLWLWQAHERMCGAILGDEMGLGKTAQIIAFLAALYCTRTRRHASDRACVLIVVPVTLLRQWVAETHTWWPQARVVLLYGRGSRGVHRRRLITSLVREYRGGDCDGGGGLVVITPYSSLLPASQCSWLVELPWCYVVLDEGHRVRNPHAQQTVAIKGVSSVHRIVLSGCPMQNNLRELWSLFDFVVPGKLGSLDEFMVETATPITQAGYANSTSLQRSIGHRCALRLRSLIAPYLLRRTKAQVSVLQLSAKTEQVVFCRLTASQLAQYKQYLRSDVVRHVLQRKTHPFVALNHLRQLCNHPTLVMSSGEWNSCQQNIDELTSASGKLVVLRALLRLWKSENTTQRTDPHRVLVFTQGRRMQAVLKRFLALDGHTYLSMSGQTPEATRQSLITRFNRPRADYYVFLLTTRVGGVGVNLTAADRVIIYDPDWNPATDEQARARAWRIGQRRDVVIYRLLIAATVEEKIYHRQIFKRFLSARVFLPGSARVDSKRLLNVFSSHQLHDLFSLPDLPQLETARGGDAKTETEQLFGSEFFATKRRSVSRRLSQNPAKVSDDCQESRMRDLARRLNRKYFGSANASHHLSSHKSSQSCDINQDSVVELDSGCEENLASTDLRANIASSSDTRPIDDIATIDCSATRSKTVPTVAENNVCANRCGKEKSSDNVQSRDTSVSGSNRTMAKYPHTPARDSGDCQSRAVQPTSLRLSSATSLSSSRTSSINSIDGLVRVEPYTQRSHRGHTARANTRCRDLTPDATTENAEVEEDYIMSRLLHSCAAVCSALRHDSVEQVYQGTGAVTSSHRDALRHTPGGGWVARSACTGDREEDTVSSADIMRALRARGTHTSHCIAAGGGGRGEVQEERVGATAVVRGQGCEYADVLLRIREFVADREVTTQQVMAEFEALVPAELSAPLFKALLNSVCVFRRLSDGVGVWRLR